MTSPYYPCAWANEDGMLCEFCDEKMIHESVTKGWALHEACRKPWKFHHESIDINTGVRTVHCPTTTSDMPKDWLCSQPGCGLWHSEHGKTVHRSIDQDKCPQCGRGICVGCKP